MSVAQQLSRGKIAERERAALKNSRAVYAKRRGVLSEDWKAKLAAHRLKQRPGCPWVFPTMRSTPKGQGNVVRAFAATVKRAGIDSDGTLLPLRPFWALNRDGAVGLPARVRPR